MSFSPSGSAQNNESDDPPENNVGRSNSKRTRSDDFTDCPTKCGRLELDKTEIIPTKRHQLSFSATSIIEFPPICRFDPSMPPIDGTSPFSELPDEMVQHIFCYIGVALSSFDFPKSACFKFSLATVCEQFKRLVNHKSSWKWNHIQLCIDSPNMTYNQNGIEINGKPFALIFGVETYSAALESLIKVAPIEAIFYCYQPFADSKTNIEKHVIDQLETHKNVLDKTVKKIEIDLSQHPKDQIRFLSFFANIEELKIEYDYRANNNKRMQLQALRYIGQYSNLRKLSITFNDRIPFKNKLARALAKKPLRELEIDADDGHRLNINYLANMCNAIHGPLEKIVFKNYFLGNIIDFVEPCQEKLKHLHYLHLTPFDQLPCTLQNSLHLLPNLTSLKLELAMDLDRMDDWREIWPLYVGWLTHCADRKQQLTIHINVTLPEAEQDYQLIEAFNDHRNQFADDWQGIAISDDAEDGSIPYICKKGNVIIFFDIE